MVGRNDPCPCGSGKKYKKCCLNKDQQVTGMVSEVMKEETIVAFQRMILSAEELHELLPNRFVVLEDKDLAFAYHVSIIFNSLRNQEKEEGLSYLDYVINRQKKKVRRESVVRSMANWRDMKPSFFEILDSENQVARAKDVFTGQEQQLLLDIPLDELDVVFGFPIQCGPYLIFPHVPIEIIDYEMDFLKEMFRLQAQEDGKSMDEFLKDYDFVFPAVDRIEEIYDEYETYKHMDFQLLPEEIEVLHGIQELRQYGNDELIKTMEEDWIDMSSNLFIQMNKPEPMIAAFEYVYREDLYPEDYKKVTLSYLAEKYNTSPGSISNRKKQIEEFHDLSFLEADSPMIMRQSPGNDFSSPTEELFRAMGEQTFENDEDIQRFIEQWNETGGEGMMPEYSDAEQLFYRAAEAPPEEQKELLKKVLELDPDYIDALVRYSDYVDNDEKEMYLKRALTLGEREFDQAFEKENAGHYWLIFETRPFMRALYAYAHHLVEKEKHKKASEIFERILYLNDNDNLGVRYDLIPLLIEIGEFEKAENLFNQFPEQTTEMMYHKVLFDAKSGKSEKELERTIRKALQTNNKVIVMMGLLPEFKNAPPTPRIGQEEYEGLQYASHYAYYWDEPLREKVRDLYE